MDVVQECALRKAARHQLASGFGKPSFAHHVPDPKNPPGKFVVEKIEKPVVPPKPSAPKSNSSAPKPKTPAPKPKPPAPKPKPSPPRQVKAPNLTKKKADEVEEEESDGGSGSEDQEEEDVSGEDVSGDEEDDGDRVEEEGDGDDDGDGVEEGGGEDDDGDDDGDGEETEEEDEEEEQVKRNIRKKRINDKPVERKSEVVLFESKKLKLDDKAVGKGKKRINDPLPISSKAKKVKVEVKDVDKKGQIMIPTDVKKEKGKKKAVTDEEIRKEKFLSIWQPLLCRTVPASFFNAILHTKAVGIRRFMEDIGFLSFYQLKIDHLPNRLARFVVGAFDCKSYNFNFGEGIGSVHVTPQTVHDILGLPIGGTSLFDLPPRADDDEFVQRWLAQFHPKTIKKIYATDIAAKLVSSTNIDFMFKVNFLMLFAATMGKAETMRAYVNLSIVKRIREDTNIASIDWCEFIHRCLADSRLPDTFGGYYNGPLYFLMLFYLDSTKFHRYPVIRSRPAIKYWSSESMSTRQELEIEEEAFGKLELYGEWNERERVEAEGFYNDALVPHLNKKGTCDIIEGLLSNICKDKLEVESVLLEAHKQFPNDESLTQLYEQYYGIFKETVSVEGVDVHLDELEVAEKATKPEKPKATEKPKAAEKDKAAEAEKSKAAVVKKPEKLAGKRKLGGKKKEAVAKEPAGKHANTAEDVAVEKPEDPAVDEQEAATRQRLEEETFTQWIEANIDIVGPLLDDCPQDVEPVNTAHPSSSVKPSKSSLSPYNGMRIDVTARCKKVEFLLGNSLFAMEGDPYELVFESLGGYHEINSVRVSMETLATTLWVDSNVIDCWAAVLNFEQIALGYPSPTKHFFPTGCITPGIIEWTLTEEAQWKLFSDAIKGQFDHEPDSRSLSMIDLAFFPIYAADHFYVVVFHLKKAKMVILDNADSRDTYASKYKQACEPLKKMFSRYLLEQKHPMHEQVDNLRAAIPKLKWRTKNNHVDCGVFAMIHMENYDGDSGKNWEFGLCEESDDQVALIKRFRYKVTTKILLHQFNTFKDYMFDLACKFEANTTEHKRVSKIVNAIKNRNKRDPESKVKTSEEAKTDPESKVKTSEEAKTMVEGKKK